MPATSFLTPTASAMQALSGPLQLGDLTLKNRNIMASLTRNRCVAPASVPNAAVREHYAQRARGGAGLILSEGVLVSPQGTAWPYAPGIWNDEQAQGWKNVTDAVHEAGSFIFCQLWHLGRLSHPDMEQQKMAGKPVPGPSAIAARGGKFRQLPGEPGYITPTPLEDPRTIVEEFRHAAQMAKKAGFDGVELHSATGYIANQFLDTSANHRMDEWGGSVENRCRLGLEIVKALIEVWGPARVGIKVGPCGGYNDVGMPLPDTLHTYTHYITSLSALKIAYIQLVRYTPQFDLPIPPPGIDVSAGGTPAICRRGTPHDVVAVYAALIKPPPSVLADHSEAAYRGCAMPLATSPLNAHNPSPTRVLVNGGLAPAEAGVLIETGVVDAAVFGGLWMTNPDLQRRIEKGVPLCLDMDMATWYGPPPGVEDVNVGYNDWPAAT